MLKKRDATKDTRTSNALAKLRLCTGSSESSMIPYVRKVCESLPYRQIALFPSPQGYEAHEDTNNIYNKMTLTKTVKTVIVIIKQLWINMIFVALT